MENGTEDTGNRAPRPKAAERPQPPNRAFVLRRLRLKVDTPLQPCTTTSRPIRLWSWLDKDGRVFLYFTQEEADLENIPLLLTSHECSFRTMLVEALAKLSITPKIVLETSSKEILKQFAVNQFGVAFMPDMVAHEEIRNYSLKKLCWAGNDFPIFSQIFIHKDKHLNMAMEGLVKIISGNTV